MNRFIASIHVESKTWLARARAPCSKHVQPSLPITSQFSYLPLFPPIPNLHYSNDKIRPYNFLSNLECIPTYLLLMLTIASFVLRFFDTYVFVVVYVQVFMSIFVCPQIGVGGPVSSHRLLPKLHRPKATKSSNQSLQSYLSFRNTKYKHYFLTF